MLPGYAIVAEIVDDFTGTKLDRPGLKQIRTMIEQDEIEVVVVYASDRLTRNLAHSLILREEFDRANVELHYCNRGKTGDTPESRMTENIEGVFNEYWREKIVEGNRRGKIGKARAGKWVGASTPYGYRKVGQGRDAILEINKEEAAIVRRIFAMYLGRDGYQPHHMLGIAVALTAEKIPISGRGRKSAKGWTDGTIRYILANTAYIGKFRYSSEIIELPDLAIIDEETFEAAQERRKQNAKKATRNRKYEYLLSGGYFKCSCGRWMVARTASDKRYGRVYQYYTCSNQRRRYLYGCIERHARADIVDQKIWDWVFGLLYDEKYLEAGINQMIERREVEIASDRERLAGVEDLLDQVEQKIRRLASAYAEEEIEVVADALRAELKQFGVQQSELKKEHTRLKATIEQGELSPQEAEAIKKLAAELRQELDTMDFETKRLLIDKLDLQVQVHYNDQGERQLKASCGIQIEPMYLSIESSRSKTATTSAPSRN